MEIGKPFLRNTLYLNAKSLNERIKFGSHCEWNSYFVNSNAIHCFYIGLQWSYHFRQIRCTNASLYKDMFVNLICILSSIYCLFSILFQTCDDR